MKRQIVDLLECRRLEFLMCLIRKTGHFLQRDQLRILLVLAALVASSLRPANSKNVGAMIKAIPANLVGKVLTTSTIGVGQNT